MTDGLIAHVVDCNTQSDWYHVTSDPHPICLSGMANPHPKVWSGFPQDHIVKLFSMIQGHQVKKKTFLLGIKFQVQRLAHPSEQGQILYCALFSSHILRTVLWSQKINGKLLQCTVITNWYCKEFCPLLPATSCSYTSLTQKAMLKLSMF